MGIQEEIRNLINQFNKDIENINNIKDLNDLKVIYLGKKSKIQDISKEMGNLDIDKKKELGQQINEYKN